MKKIISLILMIAMLISASAFAEGFTLFGKVPFGASKEEVTAMLEEYHIEVTTEKCDLGRMGRAYIDNEIPILSMYPVSIAGIDESNVIFAFDNNNKVYQCLYALGTSTKGTISYLTRDEADSMYLATHNMLTDKYGIAENQYLSAQSYYALCTYADAMGVPFTNCAEMANCTEKSIIQNLSCDKVSEWIVSLDNGDCVLIDNFIGTNKPMDNPYYQVYILYSYIPASALTQAGEVDDWL